MHVISTPHIRQEAQTFFDILQDNICDELERTDGNATFKEDHWKHPVEGGGNTRIMQNGDIFEKAGVNVSAVATTLSDTLAAKLNVAPQGVFATGISLVVHPVSPMIPAVHMNLRYLELADGNAWFGGGMDLTPYYLFEDDAHHFHSTLKSVCDNHNPSYYPRFKQWCDEYFLIKHRGETRGIGGIFFDYQKVDTFFPFVRDVGNCFMKAYRPIVERRKREPWGQQEKTWQLIRRGRYVEFNLLYDRGTLFGLETRGRVESILMSLPPEAKWVYDHVPPPGSREAKLLEVLTSPREWA